MNIEPYLARRVRNSTLKAVAEGEQTLMASMMDIPPATRPTPSKAVFFWTTRHYELLKKSGVAVCKILVKAKSAKKHFGATTEWAEQDGQLYASTIYTYGHPEPTVGHLLEIEVRRHALERVSERLGTIDTQAVRDEMAVAVSALVLHIWDKETEGYYALTPNGVAIVCMDDDGQIYIPTWISREMARPEQIDGEWTAWRGVQGASIETAAGLPVYQMRRF